MNNKFIYKYKAGARVLYEGKPSTVVSTIYNEHFNMVPTYMVITDEHFEVVKKGYITCGGKGWNVIDRYGHNVLNYYEFCTPIPEQHLTPIEDIPMVNMLIDKE